MTAQTMAATTMRHTTLARAAFTLAFAAFVLLTYANLWMRVRQLEEHRQAKGDGGNDRAVVAPKHTTSPPSPLQHLVLTPSSPPSSLPPASRFTTTIVSCFFDIGRSNWSIYYRPLEEYEKYIHVSLQLHVPMVIYVSPHYRPVIERHRPAHLMAITSIRDVGIGGQFIAAFP